MMMTLVLQYGSSSLMVASREGHLDVVIALIEGGANVNKTNKVGIIPKQCTFIRVHVYYTCTRILCTVFQSTLSPSLLYTIPIPMGTIHPYSTQGDH